MKASAAVVALLAGVPVGAARLQCESTLDCGGCKSAQPGKPLTQDFEDLYNKALADGFTRPMVCQTCQGTLLGPKWCVPTEELTGGRLRNMIAQDAKKKKDAQKQDEAKGKEAEEHGAEVATNA
ncbi:hypothetical protein ACCO45_003359 [Purpureocillium lilacinum]|uniref:Uncharacterized protein n=1 Tax=Purpureocillium lilacinum TaxID=33203 RepID=A0ACC4E030_PURLI